MKEAIPSTPTLIYFLIKDVANRHIAPATALFCHDFSCRAMGVGIVGEFLSRSRDVSSTSERIVFGLPSP
ncbi:MAG: hypothetical protein OXE78_07515 [Gammaproteobacteria bacterium]|nr:hypothetical protein [Gammaproteobacteria bacterium]